MADTPTFSLPSWLRRLLYAAGAVAALLVLGLVTAWLFVKSPFGEALVADAIIGTLSRDGDITVAIADVEGDLPSSIVLSGVTVRDAQGSWLTIDRLSVSWRPWALLTGRIVVEDVTAGAVALTRLPVPPDNQSAGSALDLDGLAATLTRLRVESVAIERFTTFYELTGQPLSGTVAGNLEPDDDGRPRLTLAVSDMTGGGTITASAALGNRLTVVLSAEAAVQGSTLTAAGTFNSRTDAISITADGTIAPETLSGVEGITFNSAVFDVNLSGTSTAPRARIGYTVTQPQIDDTVLDYLNGTAELAWDGDRLAVEAAGGLGDILPLAPALSSLLRPDLLYAVAADIAPDQQAGGSVTAVVREATLDSGDVAAAFTGTVDLSSFTGSGTATLSGRGLARLAGWTEDASDTAVRFDISQFSPSAMQATLSGGSENITASSEAITRLFDGALDIGGQVDVTSGQIGVDAFTVAGTNLNLTADANFTLQDQQLDAEILDGGLNLDVLSDDISGQMSFAGALTGLASAPAFNLRLGSEELTVGREVFRAVDLTTAADLAQSPARVAVDGSVTVAEGPIAVNLVATAQGSESLVLAPLSLTGAGVVVTGSVDVDVADGLADGTLEATFDTLAVPAAVAGVPLSGEGTLSLILTSAAGVQDATWTAQARSLRYAGAVAGLGVLDMTGRWRGGESPSLDLGLDGGNGFVGNRAVASVTARASGPFAGLTVAAEARSIDEALSLSLSGDIGMTGAQTDVRLDAFDLTDTWGSLALAEPARLALSPDRLVAEDIVFNANGGRIALDAVTDRTAGTIAASLTGTDMPFAVLQILDSDLSVAGQFDVTANLNGPLSAPEGQLRLTTTNVTLPDTGLETIGVAFTATLADQRLALNGSVTGISDAPATLSGSLPLTLNLEAGQARVPLDQPVEAALVWAGAIEPMWAVLPLVSHRLSGRGDVNLKLTGTLDAPQVAGYARLDGAAYENLDLGTLFRDIAAEITAEDTSALSLTASANDGDDGLVSGRGRLTRDGGSDFSGDLSFTMDNVRLVRRDDVKVRGSGTMTYAMTPARDRLEGDILVNAAEVSLTATYVEPVPVLDVVDPNAPAAPDRAARAGKETDLAVTVRAPAGIDVVGRGLDSEWAADVRLTGTLAAPELEGSLDVLRGEFSFLGELFELTTGQVLFTGGGTIDPDLAVVASRTTGGVAARVEVGGRASAPSITLSSDPPLPQDEILARILFGKSAGQLGPLEAVQLANAAAEFTGLAGRGGVVGTLRRSVGLDVFRFGSDAGGSTVVVGERLSKNIFVGVEQGLEGQGSQIIIEWQLTDNLALKSTSSQDTGADIGLRWSRDY